MILYFIQSESSLCVWTGHRSANGLQCLFSSHMTPLASLPNLDSASWTSFLPPHTPTCDWDTYCVFLWSADWTVPVSPTQSLKVWRCSRREKQTDLWHLEWAGVKQLWLTNCVPLYFFHDMQSLWKYATVRIIRLSRIEEKHSNRGWDLMKHRLLVGDFRMSHPGTWTESICRAVKTNGNLK